MADQMRSVYVVGIAGGSGSGKTTLVNRLKERLGDRAVVVYHDDYYKANDDLTMEERCRLNYDHPDAFETSLLIRHLEALKRWKPVEGPLYDYTVHNRRKETRQVEPAQVILVEGILILQNEALRDLMDLKVFVDAENDERILRRIQRDVEERGRSLSSVIEQYLSTVKPMHAQFVEPSRYYADILVPRGGLNDTAMDVIYRKILHHIEG